MQYVRGTVLCGIRFSESMFETHVFTDADWAGDVLTRRSTTVNVVFAAGGPLAWQSKLQTTVATSSMQSEYQAMYAGMQEIGWLRGVLAESNLWLSEPTLCFPDSQSAEDLALNPVYHMGQNMLRSSITGCGSTLIQTGVLDGHIDTYADRRAQCRYLCEGTHRNCF